MNSKVLLSFGEYLIGDENEDNLVQNFEVIALNQSFRTFSLVVVDNYGSSEYTCLYRLRVHGEPVY